MDDAQLRLDGNAAAGIMQDIFVPEMTAARAACASCGTIAAVGAEHLYMYPLAPGAVLRCHSCEEVLMVIVHARGRYRLGLRGLSWLEVHDAGSQQQAAEAPASSSNRSSTAT
jgi:Family of unknown function (DUF6510)